MNEFLTEKEVEIRRKSGLVNNANTSYSRSIKSIISTNVFTLFNAINLFLAILVFLTGYYTNLMFVFVIIINTLIATFQEIRSKIMIDKLKIAIQDKIIVIRDNVKKEINVNEIVLDDLISVKQGDQVPVDAIIINSNLCEIDESIITGESANIIKKKGDTLYSGSIIISGNANAKVISIGNNSYSSKLLKEANNIKDTGTYLRDSLNKILKLITIIIVPVMILLFISQYFFSDLTWQKAILSTVAGVIGMIPSGIILLTSITSSVGVIKMAKKNTIVQKLNGIEAMASIDILCLDKTGTITDGTFDVVDVITLNAKYQINNIVKNMIGEDIVNETDKSLDKYFTSDKKYEVIKKVPFSSYRKYSLVSFKNKGTYALGALEYMKEDNLEYSKYIDKYLDLGYRVITLMHSKEIIKNQNIPSDSKVIAFIILKDNIRQNVGETLKYFKNQGVELKILSGDNPVTVAKIMKQINYENYDMYYDCTKLPSDYYELKEIVNKYSIFGRVTPYQKREIIKILKEDKSVGMIGDGVNDILSLKEANCSIALSSGTMATRNVSQMVLIDSSFNAIPSIVLEGRRVINNIERVSSLYLVKTIYSVILSILSIILTFNYPFYPIQLTLIGSVCVGLPSFILALEPNGEKVNKNFIKNVLSNSIPSGISVGINVIILLILCNFFNQDFNNYQIVIVTTTGLINLLILYKISKKSNKIVKSLLFICALIFIIMITLFNDLFLIPKYNLYMILMILVYVVMDVYLIKYIRKIYDILNK